MGFADEVAAFLRGDLPGAWALLPDEIIPVPTPFPVWFHPRHRLAVHLPSPRPFCPDPYLFRNMSVMAQNSQVHLVHLWEDIWVRKQALVCARLRVLGGRFERIHARDTRVSRIQGPQASAFLEAYHLSGCPSSRYKYGLFLGEEMVAAATFSNKRSVVRNGEQVASYELIRYASLPGTRVCGGMGKLLRAFVREVGPGDIMTYADLDWGFGGGYESIGFHMLGQTPPLTFWVDADSGLRVRTSFSTGPASARERMVFTAGNMKYLWVPGSLPC